MAINAGGLRLTTDNKLIQVSFLRVPPNRTMTHNAKQSLYYLEWLKNIEGRTGKQFDYIVDTWNLDGTAHIATYMGRRTVDSVIQIIHERLFALSNIKASIELTAAQKKIFYDMKNQKADAYRTQLAIYKTKVPRSLHA